VAELPRFQSGQKIDDFSASQLNELVDAVRSIRNLTVRRQDGLTIRKSKSGIEIGFDRQQAVQKAPQSFDFRAVAIVSTIGDHDTSLTVREVDYADSPPGTALLFKGDPFTAYPYWGDVTVEDYKGLEFTGETPDDTTRVFDARKRGSDWIVERPSSEATGAIRVGRLIDIINGGSKVGRVQPYKVNSSGVLVSDGEIKTLPYFPGFLGFQFAEHVSWQLFVALVTMTDGQEYIQQTMPWSLDPPSAAAASRCV